MLIEMSLQVRLFLLRQGLGWAERPRLCGFLLCGRSLWVALTEESDREKEFSEQRNPQVLIHAEIFEPCGAYRLF